jgi:hypothetical protein
VQVSIDIKSLNNRVSGILQDTLINDGDTRSILSARTPSSSDGVINNPANTLRTYSAYDAEVSSHKTNYKLQEKSTLFSYDEIYSQGYA